MTNIDLAPAYNAYCKSMKQAVKECQKMLDSLKSCGIENINEEALFLFGLLKSQQSHLVLNLIDLNEMVDYIRNINPKFSGDRDDGIRVE